MSREMDEMLARLEAHWSVIEAEIREISKDIAHSEVPSAQPLPAPGCLVSLAHRKPSLSSYCRTCPDQ